MKSIMEEASSITKAIENAWSRAGQPQEFSIKILEYPKTSFFGFKTAQSAKIALFFQEVPQKAKEYSKPSPAARMPHRSSESGAGMRRSPSAQRPERSEQGRAGDNRPVERRISQPEQRRQQAREHYNGPRNASSSRPERSGSGSERHTPPYESRDSWAPEMVEYARDWVKETLVLMGKAEVTLTTNVSHNYLKIMLSQPVMPDAKQEETQLKSWGNLAMEAVREKAHKPLRSLRIILESKR